MIQDIDLARFQVFDQEELNIDQNNFDYNQDDFFIYDE
jgi:hypothetical protein